MTTAIQIDGATLTLTPDGVTLQYGWMVTKEISRDDAIKIRDWLNANFPKSTTTNGDQS